MASFVLPIKMHANGEIKSVLRFVAHQYWIPLALYKACSREAYPCTSTSPATPQSPTLCSLSLCLTGMAPWPNATGCHCQMWRPASINYLEAHPRALWRTSQERASNDNNNKTRKTDNGQLENRQLAAGNGQRAMQLVTGDWQLARQRYIMQSRHEWDTLDRVSKARQ